VAAKLHETAREIVKVLYLTSALSGGSHMTKDSSGGASLSLEAIDALVAQGKTVFSAEDSAVIELALKAIEDGKTATFYLKDVLFAEIIRRRNHTSDVALEPLSLEEVARIKADFYVECDGYSSKETCPRCKSVYGAYEFIQQGIKSTLRN
jgi:hypothetical protein